MNSFAEDTTSPDKIENLATVGYPAVVLSQPELDTMVLLGSFEPTEGIGAKFYEHTNPNYKSWVELRLSVPVVPSVDLEDQATEYTIGIRFGAKALGANGLVSLPLEAEGEIEGCLATRLDVKNAIHDSHVSAIELSFNQQDVMWKGSRANMSGVSAAHQASLALLRREVEQGVLCLLCQSGEPLTEAFSAMAEQLGAEAAGGDPVMKWHTAHPARAFIQTGMLTPVEERPSVALPAQIAFSDFGEYCIIQGYAAVQEGEHVQRTTKSWANDTYALQLVTIPGAGNRRYLGFLMLAFEQEGRLKPRDKVLINFDAEGGTDDDNWTAYVTEPLAPLTTDAVTLIVNRRKDPNNPTQYCDQEVVATLGAIDTFDDLRRLSRRFPSNTVRVTVTSSDLTLKRQINSLRKLTDQPFSEAWKRHLLGQDLRPGTFVDLYEGIEDVLPPSTFSPSQLRLFTHCRKLPDGIGLVTGPPGTGKTHAIVELLLPLLDAKSAGHQVLIATPSNDPTDVVARAIQDHLNKDAKYRDSIVIRYHSSDTEHDLVWAHARSKRPIPDEPRLTIIDEADISEDVAAMEAAMYIKEHYERSATRPSPLSNDIRMRQIEQSLGFWMLRVAGIIPGLTLESSQEWRKFRELYNRHVTQGLQPGEEVTTFKELIRSLHVYVIERADVIVTTLTNTADESLLTNFHPSVVFVDEAAKATELEIVNVIANYQPRAMLLVGDDKQLHPTVVSSARDGNNFAAQLHMSLFERLKLGGKESVLLREQHRMVTGLATIPSEVFYSSRLIDGQATTISHRPRAKVWAVFLQREYNIKGNKMFLDVQGGRCSQDSFTKSRANPDNAIAVMGLLCKAFTHGIKGAEVAIATPYQAQYQLYRAAIQRLQRHTPELAYVDVRKIDGYQGGEATFVVLDMVVTDHLGFVGDRNRINVGMTRCRDGMVVVGDIDAMRTIDRKRTAHLLSVINLFRRSRASHTVKVGDAAEDSTIRLAIESTTETPDSDEPMDVDTAADTTNSEVEVEGEDWGGEDAPAHEMEVHGSEPGW